MDPMHEALKRRKSKSMDMEMLLAHPPVGGHDTGPGLHHQQPMNGHLPSHVEGSPGDMDHEKHKQENPDLAPEVDDDGDQDVEKAHAENKAMHAKMGHDLKSELHAHELGNPEHEPIARGGMSQDATGHEELGHDPEFERMMQEGHEHDGPRVPKTLGARVRAALQSKKGHH